ncbi:hypothetical protein A2531_04360 [Candidatus Falkowbacteria bacterium RIFOXYD2_FULL_34_120]|uniref:Uncharacterized protein n=1 Tax=Candidatus Falkowbacteria bacterium RIFOXYD2_FULL_34_120 TaxID=1798007 RepID=A0A1F5TR15_9BACT|nr:MAG: hypothetical protein A2531_04360 [Candidatus Falkowbacteria bacterium RIFOXYD2_FULL_34_120]
MLVFTMVIMYGIVPSVPIVNAVDSLTNAKDTISDSDRGAVATHTFNFTTQSTTASGGVWRVIYPAGFTGVGGGSETCGYGGSYFGAASTSGQIIECIATAQVTGATSSQIIVTGVTNPNPGSATSYAIIIEKYSDEVASGGTLEERVEVRVAILDDVWMTARVSSSLTFTVTGTTTPTLNNGIVCQNPVGTTASTTPFGTLTAGVPVTICQDLSVTSNASDGYTVTVEQSAELTNDGLDTINSFNNSPDGTGSTTAVAWTSPLNLLDQKHTYGHMGLTSDDADLHSYGTGYNNFSTGNFVGLSDTNPMPVMHHTGPSLGTTPNIGYTTIAYRAEIGSLQEAGDYETQITYICTPIY